MNMSKTNWKRFLLNLKNAWHGCRYICRDIASRLCSQCIMDKISMSTPSRWRGNVVVYKCCFFWKMSLYPVSNDWANREVRQSNNRLLKLNILQMRLCRYTSRSSVLYRAKVLKLIKFCSNVSWAPDLIHSVQLTEMSITQLADGICGRFHGIFAI